MKWMLKAGYEILGCGICQWVDDFWPHQPHNLQSNVEILEDTRCESPWLNQHHFQSTFLTTTIKKLPIGFFFYRKCCIISAQ